MQSLLTFRYMFFFLSFQQGDWLIHEALTSNLNDWPKITIKIN